MPLKNNFKLERITELTFSDIRRLERTQDYGFNSVTGTQPDNYNPVDQTYMVQDCYYLWLKNPIANAIIENSIDFILGDGITYEAENQAIVDLFDEFWFDRNVNWDLESVKKVRDLSLYGEWWSKPEESKYAGKCQFHSIYPENIGKIYLDKYKEKIVKVGIKEGNDEKENKVIFWNEANKMYEGDVFCFQINKTTHQSRGLSDLFTSRDWLAMYDKSLYSTMERVGLLLAFVWDITIKGATEQQMRDKLKSIQKNPPQPGGVRVHNETEMWEDKTPNLGGRELEDIFRLFKSQPIAGSRMPEHFFGMGGDVNRASALEMNAPFYRKIKRRQREVQYIFETLLDYVLQKAKEKGTIKVKDTDEFSVILPEPDKEIAKNYAETLFKYSQALVTLESNGLIDKKVSLAVIKTIINQVGIDYDEGELDKAIEDDYDKLAKAVKKVDKKKVEKTVEPSDEEI